MKITDGQGVDQILEVVGGKSLQHSINATKVNGQIAVIGLIESNSATIEISSILAKQVNLHGASVGSPEQMQHLLDFLGEHPIQPVVDATYPFNALPEAVKYMVSGATGKVVLEVRS